MINKSLLLLLLFPCLVQAAFYLGIESGPAFTVNYLNKYFPSRIQYGLNIRTETELPFIQLQVQGNYFNFKNDPDQLTLYPVRLNAVIILPDHQLRPFCSFGGGMIWETLKKDQKVTRNNDPVFSAGAGIEYVFKIRNRTVIPSLETEYCFIYQKSQKLAKHNGEIITVDLGVKVQVF